MRRKISISLFLISLLCGTLFYAASGHNYHNAIEYDAIFSQSQNKKGGTSDRHMVDMLADDSYLIEQGDSTIFILVGNFAAHHNGTVILADSAVRYPNQSFECFGNVLINQNDTYAYGDRAEYNRANNSATIYSELVKVVDGEAVMYTYNCTFDTEEEIGYFYDGCYVRKEESLLEAERGYYNTKTHNLIAVDNVEMRDDTYIMKGDSVIFNTQTEDAQYFTNTNIWNDKDEFLYADGGTYTKALDLHHLTRNAYILSAEREVWSDTIEYYRTEEHIIGRSNIQMDDTTQKVLGFADYGEWWDNLDNALFTRRPSMINYNPDEPDSLFLAADTLWLYTIPVPPPAADSTAVDNKEIADNATEGEENKQSDISNEEDALDLSTEQDLLSNNEDTTSQIDGEEQGMEEPSDAINLNEEGDKIKSTDSTKEKKGFIKGDEKDKSPDKLGEQPKRRSNSQEHTKAELKDKGMSHDGIDKMDVPEKGNIAVPSDEIIPQDSTISEEIVVDSLMVDSLDMGPIAADSLMIDSLAVDSLAQDSIIIPTAKQLRYRAKLERRRLRDSVRTAKRMIRDSIDSIKQIELDSIKHIKDSLLRIEIDSIVAKRIAHSSKLADEEKARLERVKQKSEERNRRKIDKAKARALRRGKTYTGPDYTIDTLSKEDTTTMKELTTERDSITTDSLGADSLLVDSLGRDTLDTTPPFPEDSVYKMIKAYRRVKMYRSDSQMVCDSLVLLNTDSVIRLYIEPVMWNEDNQITSDSMAIYTRNEVLDKAHFMGDPIMGMEIDTMYYNQVGGKDMIAYFANGEVYRNDVEGNAQTIYYMQEEDSPEVTGLMYIESASISFYLDEGEIDKIAYKQNPTYVLYPMKMIPESQKLRLNDFTWFYERRPERDSVFDRTIRPTVREAIAAKQKPRFRITERIDYDRRRLVENRMWEDRVDQLTPEIIEWRNTRSTYPKK